MESIWRWTLDRVEVSGAMILAMYAVLAAGMYVQYVQPS